MNAASGEGFGGFVCWSAVTFSACYGGFSPPILVIPVSFACFAVAVLRLSSRTEFLLFEGASRELGVLRSDRFPLVCILGALHDCS